MPVQIYFSRYLHKMISTLSRTVAMYLAGAVLFTTGFAAEPAKTVLERDFTQTVKPFINEYCAGCHSGKTPAAQLDLKAYTTLTSVVQDFGHWNLLMERMERQEMPPKPMAQPPADRRQKVIEWVKAVRADELRKNAGDPGPVLAHRLSNSEYNYTIRDLTGVDIRPTREFPVDPANQAGFDNTGETLGMSPALFNKYLAAAREVADHLALTPGRFYLRARPRAFRTGSGSVRDQADRGLLRIAADGLRGLFRSRVAVQASRGAWQAHGHAGEHGDGQQSEPEVSADDLGNSGRKRDSRPASRGGGRTGREASGDVEVAARAGRGQGG